MLGRSLLSFVALASVAVLSCVSAVVDDGIYSISNAKRGGILTATLEKGSPVVLQRQLTPPSLQQWRVENRGYKGYVITHLGLTPQDPELYLSPKNPKDVLNPNQLVVSPEPFHWDLYKNTEGKVVIFVKTYVPVTPLVVGTLPNDISPPQVVVQKIRSGDPLQEWNFELRIKVQEETQSRYSPWRMQSGSLCMQ
ncbi:MAG: hypothetical protein J3Q66DRAFT_150883 [Benniella sp.]|nr:MAG: hypothetical protein J3Q66DRAFT_150883 [Benniella sp.]